VKHKTKRAASILRDKKIVTGFILGWSDVNPLDNSPVIFNQFVSHKNLTCRLFAKKLWEKSAQFLIKTEFTWQIVVRIIFKSNRGGDKIIEGEFTCTYAHDTGSEKMNAAIEAFIVSEKLNNELIGETLGRDHKSYGIYERVDYVATIIGH